MAIKRTLTSIVLAGALALGAIGCKEESNNQPEKVNQPSLNYFVDRGQQGRVADWAEAGIGVASGDLNGDGYKDIVTASPRGEVRYFENDGKGNLVYKGVVGSVGDWVEAGIGVTLVDLNNDGKLDIVTAGPRSHIKYFENNIPQKE